MSKGLSYAYKKHVSEYRIGHKLADELQQFFRKLGWMVSMCDVNAEALLGNLGVETY